MDHDQDQAVEHADQQANDELVTVEEVTIVDELLIEEISIDGMCGVY